MQDGGPIFSPAAPQSPHWPVIRKIPPSSPSRCRLQGPQRLSTFSLHRPPVRARPVSPPRAPSIVPTLLRASPKMHRLTSGENCPHPRSALPAFHNTQNPWKSVPIVSVCLFSKSLISSANSELFISCLLQMLRKRPWVHPAQLRGPGELLSGREEAGHLPLLFPAPNTSPLRDKTVSPIPPAVWR